MPQVPPRFSEQGRSGTRMLMAIPVTLMGKLPSGKSFEEKTKTVVINSSGCKFLSEYPLTIGTQMVLTIANSSRTVSVSVVWNGDTKNKQLEVGVDFAKPTPGFWGVQFPDDSTTFMADTKAAAKTAASKTAVKPAPKTTEILATPLAVSAPQSALTPTPPSPAASEAVPAKLGPVPVTSGDLASSRIPAGDQRDADVRAITAGHPQFTLTDEGLKHIGGDLLLGMVQHLVREAFQEVLTQVVEDFDRYCVSTIERVKTATIADMQTQMSTALNAAIQPALEASVAGARAQLDTVAQQISSHHAQKLESSMQYALENTQRELETRVHTYDQRLASSAGQFCTELARRLSSAA